MSSIEETEKQIQTYQDLAKENKNIDLAALTLNAIENKNRNRVSAKQKKWAYLISLGIPPLGLFFALMFYFSDKDDAKRVANICILLTVISGAIAWISVAAIFSGSGTDIQKIQQIKPKDIMQLYQ
jgi:hypothetical protein